jgi:hypothetical protein
VWLRWLRRLVVHLSLWRPGFGPRLFHVVSVVADKVALGILRFHHIQHYSTCPPYSYIMWGMNNRPFGGRSSGTYSHSIDINNNNNNNNPWRYSSDETLAGWAAAAGSLSRLHQTVLGWHVVSTSNPTAAFSTFLTGPLLLYSSNYSVYPITGLSGPRSRHKSLRKILWSARESNPGPLCL